jgi:hypothetical protein
MNAQAPLSSYNKTNQLGRNQSGQIDLDVNHKFMQTIGEEMFKELERIADEKGIRIQTLLRAVIIPEWVERELSKNPRWNSIEAQTSTREKRRDARSQAF